MRAVVLCVAVACIALGASSLTVPQPGGYSSYCNISHNGGYSVLNAIPTIASSCLTKACRM